MKKTSDNRPENSEEQQSNSGIWIDPLRLPTNLARRTPDKPAPEPSMPAEQDLADEMRIRYLKLAEIAFPQEDTKLEPSPKKRWGT